MSDKIDPKRAEFFFNGMTGEVPTEFVVADRDKRLAARGRGEGDPTEKLRGSLGAMTSDWMSEPSETPAGVFARAFLLPLEQNHRLAVLDALHEIARIDGQQWADEMIAALDFGNKHWTKREPPK